MPKVGLGTFLAAPGEVGASVTEALKLGYTHIDCAEVYENEAEVGTAMAAVFADPSSGVKREDVFITSKLPMRLARKGNVRSLLEKSLKDLQVKYLDLYLVHCSIVVQPNPNTNEESKQKLVALHGAGFGVQDLWREMEECADAGLTKAIGVSNFNAQMLNDVLMYARIKPAVNQIERHPYLQQRAFVDWCRKLGISITAYAPLGAPGLFGGSVETPLLSHPTITQIAAKYGKTAAQVLVRWAVDDDTVVIPKSIKLERVKENFDVLDFSLSTDDMKAIAGLDAGKRLFAQDWMGVPCFE